jgi:hypothetical protein
MQIEPYKPQQLDAIIRLSLIELALDWMKDAGIFIAMVDTGGDRMTAIARHTYEKAGFG